jgi:aconitate hydratase
MGILPLQFLPDQEPDTLGLRGTEEYAITGIAGGLKPKQEFTGWAKRRDGSTVQFPVLSRLDTLLEIKYYLQGGILATVLRELVNRG